MPEHPLTVQQKSLPGAARPLYAEVADVLRQRIFERSLQPGTRLDELALAAEMNISRTPMREAIKVLAAEGLVTIKVRRGAFVTEVPETDVREVYHLLGLLESDAAAEVAQHANDDALKTLALIHAQLSDCAQQLANHSQDHTLIDQFFAINQSFHQHLINYAGNGWRQQIIHDLRRVMQLGRHHSLFKQGRIQQSCDEHAAIMQALLARDSEGAANAMRIHFDNGLQAAV